MYEHVHLCVCMYPSVCLKKEKVFGRCDVSKKKINSMLCMNGRRQQKLPAWDPSGFFKFIPCLECLRLSLTCLTLRFTISSIFLLWPSTKFVSLDDSCLDKPLFDQIDIVSTNCVKKGKERGDWRASHYVHDGLQCLFLLW